MLRKIAEKRINELNRQLELRKEFKGPKVLLIAELFLVMAAGLYLLKMILISDGLSMDDPNRNKNMLMYGINLILMFLAIHAAFGVSSKRIKSWCMVVRNCGIMFITSSLSYFAQIKLDAVPELTFDPILAGLITIPVIAIMMLPVVRNFYMPPMMEKTSIVQWILCLFGINMYSSKKYELKYD